MASSAKAASAVLTTVLLYLVLATRTEAKTNAIALSSPYDVQVQLNVTSPTEDYVIQNQRQYADNIARMNDRLLAFKVNYESELNTILIQRDFLLVRMKLNDNYNYPRRMLSDLEKNCYQKYEGRLDTIDAVNASITNCATAALNQFNSYAAPPTATKTALSNHYTITLVSSLNACKKSHPDLQSQNYTNCATKAISDADAYTSTMVKQFNTQMQTAQCSANGRLNTAIDCSFSIVYNRVYIMGEVYRAIDYCSKGLEFCPPCDPQKPIFYCPNQLSVSLNISDYQSPTLKNPFYGLTEKIDCVLLNFRPNALS